MSKQFFINLENNKQYERAICLTVMLNRSDAVLDEILEKASTLGDNNIYDIIYAVVPFIIPAGCN